MAKKKTQRLEQVQEYLETENNKISKPDVVLEYKQNGFLTKENNKWIFKKGGMPNLITFPNSQSTSLLNNIDTSSIKIYDNSPSWLKTKPKEPKKKPRLLKGMVMTLKDVELIHIFYNGKIFAHTPHTMKMMYKNRPSQSWELLKELCMDRGVIDYVAKLGKHVYLEDKGVYQKRFRDLRKKLESIFDVKIKKGRDYDFYRHLDFKAITWKDEFTPEHEQYTRDMERDRDISSVIGEHYKEMKKNKFYNTEIEDDSNSDTSSDTPYSFK